MRRNMGVPTLDVVFSQARHGRINRVVESLNLGTLPEPASCVVMLVICVGV